MKLFGLTGYPLLHSFSKQFFENKFAEGGLTDHSFELFPLKHIGEFPKLIADHNLSGLAVTIPHKQAVIPFLTELDAAASEIGAVNCIRFSGGKLKGYNTDVFGFEISFIPLLKAHHKKALVLGSGGASKAVQYVLRKNGIDFLIVSRRKNAQDNSIEYADINAAMLKEFPVIINCTPVGMKPDITAKPEIPYEYLSEKNLLYDLIYSPDKTAFLAAGEERGAAIKNGMEMLVLQAEENWKIWLI